MPKNLDKALTIQCLLEKNYEASLKTFWMKCYLVKYKIVQLQ